jgi:hypothetical protein
LVVNAIFVPSGDHEGLSLPLALWVMFVSPAPFDPITKICGRGEVAALWEEDESAAGTRAIAVAATRTARRKTRDMAGR